VPGASRSPFQEIDVGTGSFDPDPVLYEPNPHFDDRVNRNIIQSEIEGGVHMRDLSPGSVVSVQTLNHLYRVVVICEDTALISGHPEFCPDPVEVRIHGSTWGGSMLRTKFLGRGMHLEFEHPVHKTIVTSRILDIQQGEEAA
jgi:NAD-dependent oxidoreductase involved in siderophore biosynthesis